MSRIFYISNEIRDVLPSEVAQHVLLAVVVAELVKFGCQILYFRRGV